MNKKAFLSLIILIFSNNIFSIPTGIFPWWRKRLNKFERYVGININVISTNLLNEKKAIKPEDPKTKVEHFINNDEEETRFEEKHFEETHFEETHFEETHFEETSFEEFQDEIETKSTLFDKLKTKLTVVPDDICRMYHGGCYVKCYHLPCHKEHKLCLKCIKKICKYEIIRGAHPPSINYNTYNQDDIDKKIMYEELKKDSLNSYKFSWKKFTEISDDRSENEFWYFQDGDGWYRYDSNRSRRNTKFWKYIKEPECPFCKTKISEMID